MTELNTTQLIGQFDGNTGTDIKTFAEIPWREYLESKNYNQDINEMCKLCIKDQKAKHGGITIACKGLASKSQYIKPEEEHNFTEEDMDLMEQAANPYHWAEKNIDVEKIGDPKRLFIPRWYQNQISSCSAARKVIRCGRRAGKSYSLALNILHKVLTNKNYWVLIVTPYEVQSEEIINLILQFLFNINPEFGTYDDLVDSYKQSPNRTINFANGSRIKAFTTGSAGAASIRGQRADLIVIDEIDYITAKDFNSIIAILADKPHTELWTASTPDGEKQLYKLSKNKRYKEFHFPSFVLPHYNDELDSEFREATDETGFVQEIIAEFGTSKHGVFQKYYVDACTALKLEVTAEEILAQRNEWIVTMGCDWNHDKVGTRILALAFNKRDRVFVIAEKATVSKEGWTQTTAMQKIIDLNRKWNFEHLYVDRGFGCIAPDSLVQTLNGLVQIKDITTLDSVMTHDGTYQKVLWHKADISKLSYKLKVNKCLDLTLSECHPTLVYSGSKLFQNDFNESDISWKMPQDIIAKKDFVLIPRQKIDYKDIKHIDVANYVNLEEMVITDDCVYLNSALCSYDKTLHIMAKECGVSTSTVSRAIRRINNNESLTEKQLLTKSHIDKRVKTDIENLKINRYIPFNKDFQTLLGWYISEGSASYGYIEISQKKDQYMEEFLYICEVAKQMFPSVSVIKREDGTLRLIIYGNIVSELFANLGGKLSHNKRIHHNLLEHSDIGHLITGIIYGDGHISSDNSIQVSMTGFEVITQIRQYFINRGVLPSIYRVKRRQPHHKDQLRIDIGGTNTTIDLINSLLHCNFLKQMDKTNRQEYIVSENYIATKINRVEQIGQIDNLVDIEVEGMHTFCASGFVVHNSTQIEILTKYGFDNFGILPMGHPDLKLSELRAIDFNSNIEIPDPYTGNPIKKHMKPFMVNNLNKIIEKKMIKFHPRVDAKLIEQLKGYEEKRGVTGRPTYKAASESVGDHDLDALMLAALAFNLEYSDLLNHGTLQMITVQRQKNAEPLEKFTDIASGRVKSLRPKSRDILFNRLQGIYNTESKTDDSLSRKTGMRARLKQGIYRRARF